jgi:hypothetical protein
MNALEHQRMTASSEEGSASTQSRLAGLGGLAFGVLAFVAMIIANPPGGNYSASSVRSFLAKGHRPEVFGSVYVMLIAVAGLLLLLGRLRTAIDGSRATLFWAFSVAAVGAWLIGYLLVVAPSVALAYSGGKLGQGSITPQVGYVFSEAGWAVMYGAGGVLLGAALVTFAAGRVTVPAWVRWATAVAGLAALAAIAWFPFFLVYLWAIVLGLWGLVASPAAVRRTAAAQPA